MLSLLLLVPPFMALAYKQYLMAFLWFVGCVVIIAFLGMAGVWIWSIIVFIIVQKSK